jgi:DNA invertase Pin-like site-specific DNA recombinase/uncharacterized membrane protein YphA (DoxX/SURF4 family)
MAITKVCIYTRISTDEESQPTSLHSQRERLEAFGKAQEDWRIVAHKQDQATGTKLDRPGLQAALDLARSGSIDLLLVYRVDRLSRKVRQLAQLTEELDALDVVLKSATESFDTGAAAGRMMLQMLAVFAEFEHATIVDRISAGIERRAKEGRWFGGRPPFGYTLSSEERVLVPDPVKTPVVQRVFDLYARNASARARSPSSSATKAHPHPRPAGAIPACAESSTTPPTSVRSAGARRYSTASTNRLSTSSPSRRRRRSCANATARYVLVWTLLETLVTIRLVIAFVFVASAVHKLASFGRFIRVVHSYAILPPRAVAPSAGALSAVEAAIAILLLYGAYTRLVAAAAGFLVSLFAGAIGVNAARRRPIDCGCGGWSGSSQVGWSLVGRNLAIAMCVCILAVSPPNSLTVLLTHHEVTPLRLTACALAAVGLLLTSTVARSVVELRRASRILPREIEPVDR